MVTKAVVEDGATVDVAAKPSESKKKEKGKDQMSTATTTTVTEAEAVAQENAQLKNIIAAMRIMMGATNPQNAAVGTIRGDYAQQTGRNLIHGSDGPESARREIELFFNDYELQNWNRSLDPWYLE